MFFFFSFFVVISLTEIQSLERKLGIEKEKKAMKVANCVETELFERLSFSILIILNLRKAVIVLPLYNIV